MIIFVGQANNFFEKKMMFSNDAVFKLDQRACITDAGLIPSDVPQQWCKFPYGHFAVCCKMLSMAHKCDRGPFLGAMSPMSVTDYFRSMKASREAQAYREAQNALKTRDAREARVASEPES